MLSGVKTVHCIGIGGIGVGALAELLMLRGYIVSGSDKVNNKMTQRLSSLSIDVYQDHAEEYVKGADLVVYSSAISPSNPELHYAMTNNMKCVRRGALMACLFNQAVGIAVAGSHGKTTTTSMVAHALVAAGFDPTYSIGGVMNHLASPVRMGGGDFFIAEADESDQSFLYLKPRYAIVTNIDHDHLNNYSNNYSELLRAFVEFLNSLPPDGVAFLNVDDVGVQQILSQLTCNVVRFSVDSSSDFTVSDILTEAMRSTFTCSLNGGDSFSVSLPVPGKHNVSNAAGCLSLLATMGLTVEHMQSAFASFSGVGRRFSYHGELDVAGGNVIFIEDYGHHPRAIDVTINAVRSSWPERRLVMVFEPHRFTRTQECWHDFVEVLARVDVLLLLEIFAANEEPVVGVSGEALAHDILAVSKNEPVFFPEKSDLLLALPSIIAAGDIILFQGAGHFGYQIPRAKQAILQGR